MFSFPSFYELGSCSAAFTSTPAAEIEDHIGNDHQLSPRSMAEAKAVAASNTHKEAERRRRKRINAHIATLKSILPNTIKTDKASLLGETVHRVRELRKTAAELASSDAPLKLIVPSETDELKLSRSDNSDLIKATLCCEDRPEIILDLIQALESVDAKVVRAEMSTMGGRTKSVLWVRLVPSPSVIASSAVGSESDVGLGRLRRALKMVMDKSTLLAGSGQSFQGSKRPRYYHL